MALWMTAVHISAYTVGLHAAALGTHLALMTTGASLNHAGYDFEIRFLGQGSREACLAAWEGDGGAMLPFEHKATMILYSTIPLLSLLQFHLGAVGI